jgi:chemotaxis family two-component system sensor kinase Cph1
VNTQEEERGRISRELHDNLGQHLTAVMLGLQALAIQIEGITGGKRQSEIPQLDHLRTLVDGLMRAAHQQAWELRPAELDALGLEAALQQLIDRWSERAQVEVDFQAHRWEQRPDSEIEITLYRVVQEALTNVVRHAQASFVSVAIEQRNGSASAVIEDNGQGFDAEQSTGRLGVLGMRERLAIVGGTLDIESIPGDGTSVIARVPLSS